MSKGKCIVAFVDDEQVMVAYAHDAKASQSKAPDNVSVADLPAYVVDNQLISSSVQAILSPSHYALFLAPKPAVSPDELTEQLLLQEAGRFEVATDQMALEYRSCAFNDQRQRVLVMCAKKAALQRCYDCLDNAGLAVKAMMISEDGYDRCLDDQYTVLIRSNRVFSQALFFVQKTLVDVVRLPKMVDHDCSPLFAAATEFVAAQKDLNAEVRWFVEAESGDQSHWEAAAKHAGIIAIQCLNWSFSGPFPVMNIMREVANASSN